MKKLFLCVLILVNSWNCNELLSMVKETPKERFKKIGEEALAKKSQLKPASKRMLESEGFVKKEKKIAPQAVKQLVKQHEAAQINLPTEKEATGKEKETPLESMFKASSQEPAERHASTKEEVSEIPSNKPSEFISFQPKSVSGDVEAIKPVKSWMYMKYLFGAGLGLAALALWQSLKTSEN